MKHILHNETLVKRISYILIHKQIKKKHPNQMRSWQNQIQCDMKSGAKLFCKKKSKEAE